MLGTTLGVADRSLVFDELSGLVLLGGYFGVTWVCNIVSAGPVEGYPLAIKTE